MEAIECFDENYWGRTRGVRLLWKGVKVMGALSAPVGMQDVAASEIEDGWAFSWVHQRLLRKYLRASLPKVTRPVLLFGRSLSLRIQSSQLGRESSSSGIVRGLLRPCRPVRNRAGKQLGGGQKGGGVELTADSVANSRQREEHGGSLGSFNFNTEAWALISGDSGRRTHAA